MLLVAGRSLADDRTGEQIYRQQCARCHGERGEGTAEHHPDPLVGDRHLGDLAKVIEETMPEDAPEQCVGDDAAKVAAYIHEAFYSPIAQARNQPARFEFARLTVRQYQNAVADLLLTGPREAWGDERGLRGEYFKSRQFDDGQRAIDRTDGAVEFDFGEGSPEKDKIPSEEFAVRWQGSVLAPDSGDYEFILESKNGARLWVNDDRQPLIDAWVRSGDEPRRETIRLLGGRAYPLRLEFYKSKDAKEKVAGIRLKWKPPQGVEELLPARNLSPRRTPPLLVVATPFPPDDRSIGYERGTAVSKEWDQATTAAAMEVADKLSGQLRERFGGGRRGGRRGGGGSGGEGGNVQDREERLRETCERLAERAFRRPLSDEERSLYVERQFEASPDSESALRRAVLLILKSPRFLYRENLADGCDGYETASWLSFALWDSIPDEELLAAAGEGRLETREQIAQQAERMLGDPRAKAKLREFLHQWLNVDRLHELSKDSQLFPGFDPAIVADLQTSLDLFLDDVVWGDASDYRQLLLADYTFLNGRLAKFYGAELPEDAGFEKMAWEPASRAGVLTHPYLMAGFAYHATSSPIHRGVFLAKNVLGRSLKPPQEAVTPISPDLHPDLTTRERIALQTKPVACAACHTMINPLGFSLEHFDAVGRFRENEKEKPIDAAGLYETRSGETIRFTGARELAAFLANSPEAHAAFVERLFHYLVKQPVRACGPETLPNLRQSFEASNFNIRRLMVEIVCESALAAKRNNE